MFKSCFNAYILANLKYCDPCGCPSSLIWVYRIVLFAVPKRERVNIAWGTEGRSAPCICSTKPSLHEALKMHNDALQLHDMHVVFSSCASSFIHFSISATVSNETDMIPF